MDAPAILLAGHLDTVPVVDPDQLVPYEKEGRIYGRGAVDMKAGVTILLEMIPYLLKNNIPFMMLFYCDEEYNFLGMKKFISEYQ